MRSRAGDPPCDKHRGVAAVELAVVAPLVVLIFLAIVEFGSLLFVRQAMILSARSGARQLAIQGASQEEAITIAQNSLATTGVSGATVTAQNAFAGSGDDAAAREIWVQIDLPAQNAMLLGDSLGLFSPGDNLSVRASFRKEGELVVAPAP